MLSRLAILEFTPFQKHFFHGGVLLQVQANGFRFAFLQVQVLKGDLLKIAFTRAKEATKLTPNRLPVNISLNTETVMKFQMFQCGLP